MPQEMTFDMNTPAGVMTVNQLDTSILDGLGGLNMNKLRPHVGIHTNALLRRYEWEEIDAAVVQVARQTLVGIQDLIQYDLVKPLSGLATMLSTYEQLGDMSAADIDMTIDSPGSEDRVTYSPVSVPIPIIHKGFRLNQRVLANQRLLGEGIETHHATTATRRVRDALEALLFNGTNTPTVDGGTIYGYTTHPSRNTGSASDFGTVTNIFSTVTSMINAAENDGYYGPYALYVAPTQYNQMRVRYNDGSGQTAIGSIMENLEQVQVVRRSDQLADGNLVLVTLSRDVVDLAIAQDITVVQWNMMGGMVEHFKVLGAMAPRIKSDATGKCGIVHFTGA